MLFLGEIDYPENEGDFGFYDGQWFIEGFFDGSYAVDFVDSKVWTVKFEVDSMLLQDLQNKSNDIDRVMASVFQDAIRLYLRVDQGVKNNEEAFTHLENYID